MLLSNLKSLSVGSDHIPWILLFTISLSEGSTNLLGVTVPNLLGYETFAAVGGTLLEVSLLPTSAQLALSKLPQRIYLDYQTSADTAERLIRGCQKNVVVSVGTLYLVCVSSALTLYLLHASDISGTDRHCNSGSDYPQFQLRWAKGKRLTSLIFPIFNLNLAWPYHYLDLTFTSVHFIPAHQQKCNDVNRYPQ
jgi:hypothetical protein